MELQQQHVLHEVMGVAFWPFLLCGIRVSRRFGYFDDCLRWMNLWFLYYAGSL